MDEGAGWSYAVNAQHVDNIAICGNQWDNNGYNVAPARADGRNVGIAGNASGNRTVPRRSVVTASLNPLAGQLIDGATEFTLAGGVATDVVSDSSNWWSV